jgi:hypothetical protein
MTDDEIRQLLQGITPISGMDRVHRGYTAIRAEAISQAGGDPVEVEAWIKTHDGETNLPYPIRDRLPAHRGQQPIAATRYHLVPKAELK